MWNDTDVALAYFISFRAYGTWLHGDKRGSIDRVHNRYKSPYVPVNPARERYTKNLLKSQPLILRGPHRTTIKSAIQETCKIRQWGLYAVNVRTTHVHSVVSARQKSSLVLNALKANATRRLREEGLWENTFSPWADKGSRRKLWNEQSVDKAIEYVLYGQGDDLPEFE